IAQMRKWMIDRDIASAEELDELEKAAKKEVREGKKAAWKAFVNPQTSVQKELLSILAPLAEQSETISDLKSEIEGIKEIHKYELLEFARKALRKTVKTPSEARENLQKWIADYTAKNQPDYSSHLYSQSKWSAKKVEEVLPTYKEDAEEVDGRIILRDNFDKIFETRANTLVFGEDSGDIGDVNQGLEGLQEKYGKFRVSDTGIRENTIIGQ